MLAMTISHMQARSKQRNLVSGALASLPQKSLFYCRTFSCSLAYSLPEGNLTRVARSTSCQDAEGQI